MARKYPRKNRKKLKWFDPFNRNKPLEVFADSDDESPSKLAGVAKRKQNKKPSKASMEQEVPRNFKQFMKGIKDFEAEENRKKEISTLLFTPSAKKKAMNSTMNKDDKSVNEKQGKVKKISSLEQWRRDTRREKKEDKELDQEEKEYFQDRVQLHERVDVPPLDLKPPVATLRNVQKQGFGVNSNLLTTPKSKSVSTPNSKLKTLTLSAKKVISSVKNDASFKRKRLINLTEVKPRGMSNDLTAERERVVQAYRELKFKKNKNSIGQFNTQVLTPVEI